MAKGTDRRSPTLVTQPRKIPAHGTHARYVSRRHSCRCYACRWAMADYMREWRRRDGPAQRRWRAKIRGDKA